jgi:hypothetical protein
VTEPTALVPGDRATTRGCAYLATSGSFGHVVVVVVVMVW